MSEKKKRPELQRDRYAEAGVDIEAGNRLIDLIRPLANKTFKSNVITEIGGFAGVYSLPTQDYKNPVLVASTDGVGTKLKIAFMMNKHDTVGIDLVAMCVNDIMVQGAEPLFMLDYLSMGRLDTAKAVEIIKGIAIGCTEAKCSLIGGETAEMPGFYPDGEYDLAGFVVGLGDNMALLDGSEIAMGCQLVGIASSGLHSNGYSLVRRIFFEEMKMSVSDHVPEFRRTLGEELLEPTRIYTRAITNLLRDFQICGISHITGGGLVENLPRILPDQCKAVIRTSSWAPPPIFQVIEREGDLSKGEMMRTFNNGIGLVVVVNEHELDDILLRLKAMGETAFHMGGVVERREDEDPIEFTD